jgi:penicillin-binding protein 1A
VGTKAESLQFVQVPEAQSALVAVDPKDGAVVSLVGGFDFFQSKYNRVTQARRQLGSAFKPFIYSAAFDKGFSPASVVLDAPIVLDETGMEQTWRPKEDEDSFYGPVRLRVAMEKSINLVSVRLMREIGADYTWNYVQRFGFDKSQLPQDLTMALGTAELSPLQVATAYSTFANGGFRVSSYYIDRILDAGGKTLYQSEPLRACSECGKPGDSLPAKAAASTPGARAAARESQLDQGVSDGKSLIPAKNLAPQVLKPQISYLISDMLADVIKHGTGQRALALNRDDIAGKTGTTNDQHDAWFSGFNGDLVATVWSGFDQDRSLGDGEQGAHVSLPTWIFFMRQALAGAPRHKPPVPDGIVTVRISPETGLLASSDDPNGIMEKFMEGNLPKPEAAEGPRTASPLNDGDKPLF